MRASSSPHHLTNPLQHPSPPITLTSIAEAMDACKRSFSCYVDECPANCLPSATCTPTYNETRYTCTCPAGQVGSGQACPEGRTPSVVLVDPATGVIKGDASATCGCQEPTPDYCATKKCGPHQVSESVSWLVR